MGVKRGNLLLFYVEPREKTVQRPDKDIIRRVLTQAKKFSRPEVFKNIKESVELALTLPLVSLGDHCFDSSSMFNWYHGDFLTQGGREHEVAEPVFDEFVFHFKDNIAFSPEVGENFRHHEAIIWAVFTNIDQSEKHPRNHLDYEVGKWKDELFENCRIKFLDLCFYVPTEPSLNMCTWRGFVGFKVDKLGQLSLTNPQIIHSQPTDETQEYWGDIVSGINELASGVFEKAQILWLYAKYGDKHIVEVAPTNNKAKAPKKSSLYKNRPWLTASGPHILFLDRMPTTQKAGTGTHASPKPHRRRGHWKTLNHPRFRHHPQYQQKIYVKPSFVGPRQTTYEGNIYRLVQPLEERLS